MKKTHIILICALAISVAIFIVQMGSVSQYATFVQAKENPGSSYHVIGKWVKAKGYTYDGLKPNYFAFPMQDTLGNMTQVEYRKEKPSDFERAEKIVVAGKMKDGHFEASDILMKCPSKYNSETPQIKTSLR